MEHSLETLYLYLASTLSYRVVGACLLSVPATHVAGLLILRHPKTVLKLSAARGGSRHVLLAALSYVSGAIRA